MPSPYPKTRIIRRKFNGENRFVQILKEYECIMLMMPCLDMMTFKAIAYSCTTLSEGAGISNQRMFENLSARFRFVRLDEMPEHDFFRFKKGPRG
ncbi:uncharacterized protein K460DRAFT_361440 [Cucurbitaria berberidis CBS 394.84]|uniref:Uncharacterized protein n=1 Tax=Cucurbitaria berberidis CBS 394.84 TaxID=1168544 RepID=A0A9P4GQC1_9PLEO|nr:uncharacterized protein K460DRAFT_361440 [Cucurbitaria berberidis CBS 394.84]KAF1850678.1 hypothetical protein K460DRAFT_361440 [Cucurbitaria berberidis CBS 394.84]